MKRLKPTICFWLAAMLQLSMAQSGFYKYYDEGVKNIEKEDVKSAIANFDKALDHKKECDNKYKIADVYLYRGLCQYSLKKFNKAINDMDEALALKKDYIKAYNYKTMVYLADKRYAECVEWCDKGLAFNPVNEDLLVNKMEGLSSLKKYVEAKACLLKILENDPRNTNALKFLGATNLKQHYWDSATFYFAKVIEINPLDAASFFDLGISKSYLKDYKGAQEDIEKAMKIDTAMKFVGYNNLGFFLKIEQNDFDGALVYFDKAIALKPDFAFAYSNRGFVKLNLGDVKGAHKDLRKSIELDNTNSYAFKNLGLIYLKENNKKSACENFKKAVALGYAEMYDDEVDKLLRENCN